MKIIKGKANYHLCITKAIFHKGFSEFLRILPRINFCVVGQG